MRLTEEEIRIAQLFSAVTSVDPILVITAEAPHGRAAVVLVPCRTGGLAVGRGGENVKWVARLAKIASLFVVEDCGDPAHALRWFYADIGADVVWDGGALRVRVPAGSLGRAVGRQGWRAALAGRLAQLYGMRVAVEEEGG